MTPEQRERVAELLEEALKREPGHRDAFLNDSSEKIMGKLGLR
jgi:hypothetical protein